MTHEAIGIDLSVVQDQALVTPCRESWTVSFAVQSISATMLSKSQQLLQMLETII